MGLYFEWEQPSNAKELPELSTTRLPSFLPLSVINIRPTDPFAKFHTIANTS